MFQTYELVVNPTMLMVALAVFGLVIIALTWREWRHDRPLHDTLRCTWTWIFRRGPVQERNASAER